jgi:hypothetical protein
MIFSLFFNVTVHVSGNISLQEQNHFVNRQLWRKFGFQRSDGIDEKASASKDT